MGGMNDANKKSRLILALVLVAAAAGVVGVILYVAWLPAVIGGVLSRSRSTNSWRLGDVTSPQIPGQHGAFRHDRDRAHCRLDG